MTLRKPFLTRSLLSMVLVFAACGESDDDAHDASVGDDDDDVIDAGPDAPDVPVEDCNNILDDDGDDLADCLDPDCADDPACDGATGATCDEPQVAAVPSVQNGSLSGESLADGSCQAPGGADFVYVVTPDQIATLQLSLDGPADIGVYVQTACGDSGTEIGCADGQLGGKAETLVVNTTPGVPLYVIVGGYMAGQEGVFSLTLTYGAPIPPESDCVDFDDNDSDGLVDCGDPDACQGLPICDPGAGVTGAPCTVHNDCAAAGGDPMCISEAQFSFPDGYCSEFCDVVTNDCGGGGRCLTVGLQNGYGLCFDGCVDTGDCRPGYSCQEPSPGGKVCLIAEICGNDNDDDQDGATDCEDSDCAGPSCPTVEEICAAAVVAVAGDNPGDTTDGSTILGASCTGSSGTHEDVFAFTPGVLGETGTLTITLSSVTDQGIYVRSDCEVAGSELACRDAVTGGVDEVIVLPVQGGVPLTIVVDGLADAIKAGPYTLNLAYVADPA